MPWRSKQRVTHGDRDKIRLVSTLLFDRRPLNTARPAMMTSWPSVLCPIDFSEPSRSALCYAAAIADHFGAHLTVLAVDDPLLTEAAASTGQAPSLANATL